MMVFGFMWTIAFDILRSLNSARHSGVPLFPIIFTLWNTRVYVSSSDSSDIPSHIKVLIDKSFGLTPALNIPNVNSNNRHI